MGRIGEMDWGHPGDSHEAVPDRGAVCRTGRGGWRMCGGDVCQGWGVQGHAHFVVSTVCWWQVVWLKWIRV